MREKFQKKVALQDLRLKKFNQVNAENERKRRIINDKSAELGRLREEVEGLREKARERDAFNNKNKELVTKYYGQSSAVQERDKRIAELKTQNEKLQELLRELQKNPSTKNSMINGVPSHSPQRGESLVKKSAKAATALPPQPSGVAFQPMYTAINAELIFRSIKKLPLILASDTPQLKSYLNTHQDDLKREVEYITKKLEHIRFQALNRLGKKASKISAFQEASFKTYTELEKFVELTLGVPEKDFKKFIIFNLLLNSPSIKSLTDISLTPLIDLAMKQAQPPPSGQLETMQSQDNQRGQASTAVDEKPTNTGQQQKTILKSKSPSQKMLAKTGQSSS